MEQYLKTKKNSNHLIAKYISCRLVTFVVILLACVYLSYYFSLSSLSDEFLCSIKSGVLRNDSTIPDRFQCKLIAVGIFQLLSFINLIVYALLAPVVIYTLFVPFRQKTDVLKVYEILPTFDVLHFKSEGYNDLSLYNLFLEENISELKSYKCLKVLENIKSNGQGIDPMLLLTNLGMIKMDVIDGKTPVSSEIKGEDQRSRTGEFKGTLALWTGAPLQQSGCLYPAHHLNHCLGAVLGESVGTQVSKPGWICASPCLPLRPLVVLSVSCSLSHAPPLFLTSFLLSLACLPACTSHLFVLLCLSFSLVSVVCSLTNRTCLQYILISYPASPNISPSPVPILSFFFFFFLMTH